MKMQKLINIKNVFEKIPKIERTIVNDKLRKKKSKKKNKNEMSIQTIQKKTSFFPANIQRNKKKTKSNN